MAEKKSQTKSKLRVTMVRGGAHRKPAQRQALIGLGLTHRGRTRELEDTPAVRGMIRQVAHIVKVEPAQ
jgi:large subunit ribosomal protein L30